jgi:hypothetical protein
VGWIQQARFGGAGSLQEKNTKRTQFGVQYSDFKGHLGDVTNPISSEEAK